MDNKTIVLNTNIVRYFGKKYGYSYSNLLEKFDEFIFCQEISEHPYVHDIVFNSKDSRDKALNLLKEWTTEHKIGFPFFYKGEKVTQDMLNELLLNNGDFSSWEKYKDL